MKGGGTNNWVVTRPWNEESWPGFWDQTLMFLSFGICL